MPQFTELRAVIIDDTDAKRQKLMTALGSLDVFTLGEVTTWDYAVHAMETLEEPGNIIQPANLILLDGNLTSRSSGCGQGAELIRYALMKGVAAPMSIIERGLLPEGERLQRIIIGCADDHQNAYAGALEGALYRPYEDGPEVLEAILGNVYSALGFQQPN